MGYTKNDSLFGNIIKETSSGSGKPKGSILGDKINQSNLQKFKLVDIVDIDWDSAKFTTFSKLTTQPGGPKEAHGNYIVYDNKYKLFGGVYSYSAEDKTYTELDAFPESEGSYYAYLYNSYVEYDYTKHTDKLFYEGTDTIIEDSSDFVEYINNLNTGGKGMPDISATEVYNYLIGKENEETTA